MATKNNKASQKEKIEESVKKEEEALVSLEYYLKSITAHQSVAFWAKKRFLDQGSKTITEWVRIFKEEGVV